MAHFMCVALLAVAVTASSIGTSLLPRGKAKAIPEFPFDPDTAKFCVWWFDNPDTTPPWTCEEIETLHGVSLQDFVFWNPSLRGDLCQMNPNQSYCLSALDEQHRGPGANSPTIPEPATVTVISTSVLEAPAPPPVTLTVVFTPEPPAPLTVTVLSTEAAPVVTPPTVTVVSTVQAPAIAPVTVTAVSVSVRTVLETLTLPPVTLPPATVTAVSTRVTTLPAQITSIPFTVPTTVTQTVQVPTTRTSTILSVSVSVSPTTITAIRTTTATQISTATATKTNTVTATVTVTQKVTVQVQVPPTTCIQPPPTKPTNNGINTPSPTQDGLTSNCKTFHFVQPGENCEIIAHKFGIPTDKFISWNQGAKKDCTTLWAGTWACVAVL
ncbi:hypothetical protein V8F20_008097 [Naviculisporaceae sp. PSN 640]